MEQQDYNVLLVEMFIDLGAGYTRVFSLCQFSELNTDCCRIYCMLVRCQYKGLINSTINHHKTMKLSKERNKKEKQRLYTEVEDGIYYLQLNSHLYFGCQHLTESCLNKKTCHILYGAVYLRWVLNVNLNQTSVKEVYVITYPSVQDQKYIKMKNYNTFLKMVHNKNAFYFTQSIKKATSQCQKKYFWYEMLVR